MKRITSLLLIAVLMQTILVAQTFAETKVEKRIGKMKAEIARLGTGTDTRIKVKLRDKTQIEGYVLESNETQFVVMSAKTGEPVPVAYPAVKQIRGNNLHTGVKILIGVGIFIAAIAIILAIYKKQGGG